MIIIYDEHEPFKKMDYSAQIRDLYRSTRLINKEIMSKAPFPLNLMGECIDNKGDIRK